MRFSNFPRMGNANIRRVVWLLVGVLLLASGAVAQQPATEYQGATALALELRRLGTTKRVLMIGAHPDDENTQILSTLALRDGADVAYLSLTRGEGGQNGIGPELQEGLGLIRSEELLAARQLDGAVQFFTRAYDYGFSKSAEEAFQHWPRGELLEDVVAVIRHYRPDVVVSIFSGTPADGHGQHQAAGLLAREAFEAAGDPSRFPEQIEAGLEPHAPVRLFQALWRGSDAPDLLLHTGEYDLLLGASHFQVAMESRSRHRSQDMGQPRPLGPHSSGFDLLLDGTGDEGRLTSLFTGIDTTLSAHAASVGATPEQQAQLQAYEAKLLEIHDRFNPLRPERIVEDLAVSLRELREVRGTLPAGTLRNLIESEERDLSAALRRAAGVVIDAAVDSETLTPGQTAELAVTVWNGGSDPVELRRLDPDVPAGWQATALDPLPSRVEPGSTVTRRFQLVVPADATPDIPYFLRHPRDGDLYHWDSQTGGIGIPFEPPSISTVSELVISSQAVEAQTPAWHRFVDQRQGEVKRPVRVVEAASVTVSPSAAVVPIDDDATAGQPVRVRVAVRAEAPHGLTGTLALEAPDGWKVEPAAREVRFDRKGEEQGFEFMVHPPSELAPGKVPLEARLMASDGRTYNRGYTLVDYPHIQPQPLYRNAEVQVSAFPIEVPADLHIGYIPGAGDDAPEALRQLGVAVTVLDGEMLTTGALDRFDAILTGIRAYEVNPALVAANSRVLDYARRGGTVVVQYSKYEYTDPGIAPYPVSMSRPHDRVTDEHAPVRILHPEHQALSWPNRITDADFDGWVQERGLYFLGEWDDRYTPLLEMADPGEEPLHGSLLVAAVGEGLYVYTGLAFFRQIPQGVPGAHRLLVNLLSLGRQR